MLATLLGRNSSATGLATRSLENPRVSLNDPAAYDYLDASGAPTESGMSVTPKTALRLAPVWQAVNMISGDIAKLPLDLFKKDETEGRVVATTHKSRRLVRRRASSNVTALDLWQTAMVHALIWNNGYIFIDRNQNLEPIGLYNMLPDRTTPQIMHGELQYLTETSKQDGSPWIRPIPARDVMHIKGISLDGNTAPQLIEFAKHSWGCALAAQKFEAKFFKNGLRNGGVLELPIGTKPKVADAVEEGWKKTYNDDNWFRTAILRDGAKFHAQTMTLEQAQKSEIDKEKVRDVARFFNLAPSRLGLADSVSHGSRIEDNRDYLDTTLDIWLQKIAAQCWLRLLTEPEREAEQLYYEHNTGALVRMNIKDQNAAYSIAYGRWLTRNEIRAMNNLPSAGPEGDLFVATPFVGASTGGAEKKGNDAPRGPAKRDDDSSPPAGIVSTDEAAVTPRDEATSHARRRIAFRIGDHVRQKLAKGERAFVELVDGHLATHRAYATSLEQDETLIDQAETLLRAIIDQSPRPTNLAFEIDKAMTALEASA